jgi:hypothetical protein
MLCYAQWKWSIKLPLPWCIQGQLHDHGGSNVANIGMISP